MPVAQTPNRAAVACPWPRTLHANIMILRRLMRFYIVLAAALSIASLSACGQKGALYLRDNPPAGVKLPKPPVPKPVPYPADPTEKPAAQD